MPGRTTDGTVWTSVHCIVWGVSTHGISRCGIGSAPCESVSKSFRRRAVGIGIGTDSAVRGTQDRQYDGVKSTSTGTISIRPTHIRIVMTTFAVAENDS